MKRLFLIAALVLALAVPAIAAPPSQLNYGCGLGATVFKDGQANDSLLLQLVATFLNGLCGNGTFGITSGTSECAPPAKTVSIDRLNEFAYRNLQARFTEIFPSPAVETAHVVDAITTIAAQG